MKNRKKNTNKEIRKDLEGENTTEFIIKFKHSSRDGRASWLTQLGALLVIICFLWGMFGAFLK